MVSRPVRDHFGLENGLEIWSRHSVVTIGDGVVECDGGDGEGLRSLT